MRVIELDLDSLKEGKTDCNDSTLTCIHPILESASTFMMAVEAIHKEDVFQIESQYTCNFSSHIQGYKYASISTESFKKTLRHLLAFVLFGKLTLKPISSTMMVQQFDWRGRYVRYIFVFEAI